MASANVLKISLGFSIQCDFLYKLVLNKECGKSVNKVLCETALQ